MNFLKNPIFNGITEEEYNELAAPGCTRTSRYAKDQAVFCTGDQTTAFGILLSGELHIENIDLWGNRIILHNISAGEAFAETYALSRIPMMVDVTASRYPHPHHDLSVSRGGPVREPASHHPLQPPADGGLPERGPERTVKRTGENAG